MSYFFFQEKSGKPNKLPVLYARNKDMEVIQNVLDIWCDYYRQDLNFTVYDIQTLFSLMLKTLLNDNGIKSESLSYHQLDQDYHNHAPGISCEVIFQ